MLSPTRFPFSFHSRVVVISFLVESLESREIYIFLCSFIPFLPFSYFELFKYVLFNPCYFFSHFSLYLLKLFIPFAWFFREEIFANIFPRRIHSATIPLDRSFEFNHVNCRCLELPPNDPPREINAGGTVSSLELLPHSISMYALEGSKEHRSTCLHKLWERLDFVHSLSAV